MTKSNKLQRTKSKYNYISRKADFEKRYGNEKDLGKAIIVEQDLREKITNLQDLKNRYSKVNGEA